MKQQQEIRMPGYLVDTFKRYSPRIIFTSIFSLLMIGLCVAMLFLPVASFVTKVDGGDVTYTFKGLDLIVDFFKGDDSKYADLLTYIGKLGSSAKFEAGILRNVINVFFISTPILFLVIAFHLVFLAIFALKGLIYGKWSNYKGPTSFSRAALIILIFIPGVMIANKFLLPGFTSNNVSVKDELYSYIFMGGALVIQVVIHSIYYLGLKNCYLESDVTLAKKDDPAIIESYAPLESKKASKPAQENVQSKNPESFQQAQQQAIGLPANITSIGGHAYSANMNLRLAVIPEGVPSIGDGAFSNCGNLTLVSIPKSIKSIGANAFFNCANLKRINYSGSKADWSKIARGSNWLFQGGTNVVVCIDGTIVVDPLS